MARAFNQYAGVCSCLANPKRLDIINLLKNGEKPVAWLLKRTRLLKANLSQHLKVLRSKGMVTTRREGLTIYYRIANPKLIKACDLIREVMKDQSRSTKGGRHGKR